MEGLVLSRERTIFLAGVDLLIVPAHVVIYTGETGLIDVVRKNFGEGIIFVEVLPAVQCGGA